MNKKAFIVIGPESSGTRVMTEIFIKSGCSGDFGHQQYFDETPPSSEKLVVWRRSIPHAKVKEPDIKKMYNKLVEEKYDVTVIVTTRDMSCMIKSQINAPHILSEEEGIKNISDAYLFIFSLINELKVKYYVVSYESLILHQESTINYLSSLIGISLSPIEFRNENIKWNNT